MSQITKVLKVTVTLGMNRYAVPENIARFHVRQTTQHAQHAGFADTVGTCDVQPVSSLQHTIHIFEKLTPTLDAAKFGKSQ
jgi:hypothetical protein